MDTLRQDLRFALRTFGQSPGFAAAAVLSMALGIGVNTLIFGLVQATLLRPLPVADPERVVALTMVKPRAGIADAGFSYPDFQELRQAIQRQATAFAGVAGHRGGGGLTLRGEGEPERVDVDAVSADLFPLLGVRPILGRGFRPDEDRPGAPGVLLLAHDLWQRRFGGDPGIVGRTVLANAAPFTVVGVMPAGFQFPDRQEAWVPLGSQVVEAASRTRRTVFVLARLRPGVALAAARAEVRTIAHRLAVHYPEANRGWSAEVWPLRRQFVGRRYELLLFALSGAVGFVLLIACANVSNLLLARATGRRREIALRAALGAGRGRLVRQILTEGVLLAAAGGALGLLVALWGNHLIRAAVSPLPFWVRLGVDTPVLLFTAAAAVGTGGLAALLPALRATGADLHASLQQAGGGAVSGAAGHRLRHGLVVAEVALAFVLLAGTGLFLASLREIRRVDPGYDTHHLLTLRTFLAGDPYSAVETRVRRAEELARRLAALPGVRAAVAATSLPVYEGLGGRIEIEGRESPAGEEPTAGFVAGTAGYFAALGAPLERGRPLTARETGTLSGVAVINRAFARRYFAGEDPIGRRFRSLEAPGGSGGWFTVVGLVGNLRSGDVREEPRPTAYVPFPYGSGRALLLLLQSERDPAELAGVVRREVLAADPGLPVFDVHTLDELLELRSTLDRLVAHAFALFGGIALLLAAMGVYGVLSYLVSQSRREIGIHLALGARRRDVVRLVVGRGMAAVAAGVALGLLGAGGVLPLLARALYNVRPSEPKVFAGLAGIALLLFAAALLAASLPARRALQADPCEVLRSE